MNYVIIGTCGHHHQALEATRNGFCPAPLGVAAGSAARTQARFLKKRARSSLVLGAGCWMK